MEETNVNVWLEIAEEDLSTAEVCLNSKKYLWAMVMCQQSLEKLMKAYYTKQTGLIPEKTHNLIRLAKVINLFEEMSEDVLELLDGLLICYLGSRYPDQRAKLLRQFNETYSKETFKKTKEVYLWIKSKL